MRLRLVVAIMTLLAAAILVLPAAAEGPVDVRVVEANDANFPTVTLLLEVDEGERPVANLSPTELRVSEDGAPARVVSVQRATDLALPLNLVLTLDISGSMVGERLAIAKGAATAMVANLQPQDAAAVLSFAEGARIEQPLGTAREAVLASIGALQASGNTALYDAVRLSSEVAGNAEGRHAVVLLSDGEDYGGVSTATRDASIAAAVASGAIFYVVGLEGGELDRAFLEELASKSGGAYFPAPTPQDLPEIYSVIEERLRSQFVVTVTSAAPAAETSRTIHVEVTRPTGIGSSDLAYTSLRPAPTPPPQATAAAPTPVPTVTAPATGGSNSNIPIAATVGAVLLLLAATTAAGFLWRRQRSAARDTPPARPTPAVVQRPGPAEFLAPPVARLIGVGNAPSFDLRAMPLAVGSGSDCQVVLPGEPGIAALHARLWWRDQRAMLHHVGPGYQTLVNGAPADWVSLEPGDRVQFGPYEFVFEPITTPEPQPAPVGSAPGQ